MKKYFTKEQIEKLKEAENYFYTAVHENYKRASTASLNDKIADIYDSVTGEKLRRNWTCGACVLSCYRAVGQLYFESIKYWEEQETATVPEKPEEPVKVEGETEPNAPKKTSTKKVANKGKNTTKKGK